MFLEKKSKLTGKLHMRELPYTQSEFELRYAMWKYQGALVQDAFPELSKDDREFVLSGITPEEWDRAFADA